MGKKRVTIYLEEEVWRKLRHLAIEKKTSASQLLEKMIKEKLK